MGLLMLGCFSQWVFYYGIFYAVLCQLFLLLRLKLKQCKCTCFTCEFSASLVFPPVSGFVLLFSVSCASSPRISPRDFVTNLSMDISSGGAFLGGGPLTAPSHWRRA